MVEASAKLKYILLIDALIFLFCINGIISVDQKAKLPFELTGQDSSFSIIIPKQNPYNLSNGDVLLAVDGYKINFGEKAEFITDRKNIGDKVLLSVLTPSGKINFFVKLTSYYSTFYLISTIIVALLFFVIGVFVLIKKSDVKSAHIFHWSSIGIAVMMCLTWANQNTVSIIPEYIFRILFHIAYVFVPPLFVHFSLLFPRDITRKWQNLIKLNYLIALILALWVNYLFVYSLFVFTDNLIDNYLIAFNVIRIYLIIEVIISISIFITTFLSEKGKVERIQLKWLLLGFIIGPMSFVILWVLPLLFTGKAVVPEEIVMILLCAIPITFAIAIIKYHMLDIDAVLNRSIVYGIVLALLILLYIGIIGISISYFKISNEAPISAMAAIVIALLFTPIKKRVQDFVDKKFFRVQYNFRKEVNKFITQIKNYIDINSLGVYLIREIDTLIPVEKIAFSELENLTGKLYIRSQKNFDQIANKSLSIKPETLERKWFQIAAVKNKVDSEANISTLLQNTLLRWKITLVVPIKSVKDELYGFILLGNKKSGTRFSVEDIDLLKDIGINAGATIERIKLQEMIIREKLEAERLEELNKQKSMFVSIVSHDLKTPLTAIKIFSEFLLENEKSISEKSKNHLEIIGGETDRLTRLINNVLDFSKIENGVKYYSFRQTHLNKIIEEVINFMQYTLKMKGFTLETKLENFNDLIWGDADAITEAVENIVSNAIRFSTERREIFVSTFSSEDFACVSVKDNGIGINQSDIKKIFDPFFRSENARVKGIEGSGLGLSIVKHIVEKHKGKIKIDSTPDLGSIFTICFPVLSNNNGGYDEENYNH